MEQDTPVKVCNRCGIAKPLDRFGPASWCKDGVRGTCKACRTPDEHVPVAEKHCRGCDTTKPFGEFNRRSTVADGYAQRCRQCVKAVKAASYQRNKDKHNAKSRANYEANAERYKDAAARWKEANPEKVAEYGRIGQQRHRAKRAARSAEWKAANPDKVSEAWRRRRARVKGARIGEVDLDLLWSEQAGLCALCLDPIDRTLKFPNGMSPSIDHIVPLALGGTHEQANIQWAHLVCNQRKGAKAP